MSPPAPYSPSSFLAVRDLAKAFKQPPRPPVLAVDGVSVEMEPGEVLAVVGPSGCGKTTLLRLLAGLEVPDLGSVRLAGLDVTLVPPAARNIAMVFQQPALYPHLTAAQNITVGLEIRKTPGPEITRRFRQVAESLNLTDCLGRRPEALSGGERQRVGLARALVRQPQLLLLDEPLSQLDAPMRLELRCQIARVLAESRLPAIYVTHDQAEALSLGSRVAVMNCGRFEQVAVPETLYARPTNVFVAGFVGSPPMNLLPARIVARTSGRRIVLDAESPAGTAFELPVPGDLEPALGGCRNERLVLGIRPEDFDLSGERSGPDLPELPIERIEAAGADTWVRMAWNGRSIVARAPRGFVAQVGEPRKFSISHLHLFDQATGRRIP